MGEAGAYSRGREQDTPRYGNQEQGWFPGENDSACRGSGRGQGEGLSAFLPISMSPSAALMTRIHVEREILTRSQRDALQPPFCLVGFHHPWIPGHVYGQTDSRASICLMRCSTSPWPHQREKKEKCHGDSESQTKPLALGGRSGDWRMLSPTATSGTALGSFKYHLHASGTGRECLPLTALNCKVGRMMLIAQGYH